MITISCIRNDCGAIGNVAGAARVKPSGRRGRPDGRATRSFFNGIMQAAGKKEPQAQVNCANQQNDKCRRHNSEFDGGCAAIIVPECCEVGLRHDQFNRISDVLTIGVVNAFATVMPGNSGA